MKQTDISEGEGRVQCHMDILGLYMQYSANLYSLVGTLAKKPQSKIISQFSLQLPVAGH